MNQVTPLRPLYNVIRETCPPWCIWKADGHSMRRIDQGRTTVIVHGTSMLDDELLVELRREVTVGPDGMPESVREWLQVGDTAYALRHVPALAEAIDHARRAVALGGIR